MFVPRRVFIEPDALNYPLGKKLKSRFAAMGIPVLTTASHNRVPGIPGSLPQKAYMEAKKTLVIGVRRTKKFESCRPSADYQLPLVTSCPGQCEYCYLATTLGSRPYIRIYVNLDEILKWAAQYIDDRSPGVTVFEGSATSDPVPVEPYTSSLATTIEFFARQGKGRFRFVTKFDDLDTVLKAEHKGQTEIRFSINARSVIRKFEHGTPPLERRLAAAVSVHKAGYPVGFLVAPILLFPGWEDAYSDMFDIVKSYFSGDSISFEFITHRFTARAKSRILSVFPDTELDMDEGKRRFKYGQFGYGKYVYPPEKIKELTSFFTERALTVSDKAVVLYTV